MGKGGEQRKAAPEHRTKNDDQLTRVAISQRPHKRRGDHIKAEEGAGEISDLNLAQMEFVLHQRLHREQHIAVRIVEQIERGKYEQRATGLKLSARSQVVGI